MKNIQRIAVIALLSLCLLACSGGDEAGSASKTAAQEAGETMTFPPMGVDDLDAFLQKNNGTPTIAMVWTTWCPSCKQALPELEALYKSHGDRVNILAVSMDESKTALSKFFEEKTLDLPVYHGDEALARKFGIEAIPTMLIFDKGGQLIMNEAGVFPHSMLSAMADKLAAQ